LSENGGVKIGSGGSYKVHSDFRIFGTMNPAEYSGRSSMSPAYKDRWTSYKFVPQPSQESYEEMIRLMVYGEQPEVVIRGQRYKAEESAPLFEKLNSITNLRPFIAKMAKFQVTMERLARENEIGRSKREKYIFTRRGIIEFLGYLENKTMVDRRTGEHRSIMDDPKGVILRALQYYFLDKITNEEDMQKVVDHMDAIGISENKWSSGNIGWVDKTVDGAEVFMQGIFGKVEDRYKKRLETMKYKTIDGDEIEFDISARACEPFGFRHGDCIKEKGSGYESIVVGVHDGRLWFHETGDSGARAIGEIEEYELVMPAKEYKKFLEIERNKDRKFRYPSGEYVYITEEKERYGFRVGGKLSIKDVHNHGIRNDILSAEDLEVVGFSKEGYTIIRADGDWIFRAEGEQLDDFEVKQK